MTMGAKSKFAKRSVAVMTAASMLIVAQAATAEAAPAPTTAAGFTTMLQNKNDMTWSGSDQMTSFKAPNGIVYWLAGDTMISNGEDPDGSYPDTGTSMVPNRILMQSGNKLTNAMANNGLGVPNPPTHTAENQERYWPQGMFYANNYLYVLAQRVIKDSTPNSIGFKVIGSELAKYSVSRFTGKLTLVGMKSTPSTGTVDVPGPAGIQWAGDAIVKDGYVYVYGATRASGNPYVLHYSYVSRVPVSSVENTSAWRFYKKTTNQWVASTAELNTDVVNQPDAIVASQLTSARVIGGKIVLAHKPWNNWGSEVYAEIGTAPQGPFVQKLMFQSPAGQWEGKNYETYAPMLHPEQTLSGADAKKILVSINWNGVDFFSDVIGNADLAKPRFYAVTLP
jgi:hypothetical protein